MSEPKEQGDVSFVETLLGLLPTVAGVIGALVVGAIVAAIMRRVVAGFIDRSGLEVAAERAGAARVLYKIGVRGGVAKFGGRVAGWLVWFVTLYAVLSQLGLQAVNDVIASGVAMVPDVAAAGVILACGAIGGGALRKVIAGDGESGSRVLAGKLASWTVIGLVASVALAQLGLAVELVNRLVEVVFASLALGAAVLFGVGAKGAFSNVFARHYACKLLRVGDEVRLGEHEGVVSRFLPQSIELNTLDGASVLVPYSSLMSRSFVFEPVDGSMGEAPAGE